MTIIPAGYFSLPPLRNCPPRPRPTMLATMLCLAAATAGFGAIVPPGAWQVRGTIVDTRIPQRGPSEDNRLEISGHCRDGHVLLEVNPVKTEDEIAENAGWNGEFLYLIQRFPEMPGRGLPRSKAMGYVEPSLFSRYATHALVSVLLTFAEDAALTRLSNGEELVILGVQRKFPEEDNRYQVKKGADGSLTIEAHCPGQRVISTGNAPIAGLAGGFVRWTYKSALTRATDGRYQIATEYKRYGTIEDRVVPERSVVAQLTLAPDPAPPADYRPAIPEEKLTVVDYGARPQLFPLNKGLADQNYSYEVANHTWTFDRSVITADFERRKSYLVAHGVPFESMDVPHMAPPPNNHRTALLWSIIAFSVLVPAAIIVGARRTARNSR